jgi:hypothetical protein
MISFTGNLEHLPIIDVMQLLHQTRKSGILRVKGRKGESQLVFKDGYMVSANHLNNSIRIGQILVDLKIIAREILDKTLLVQGSAGAERKPLIVTLIDQGLVNEKDAYKGLEHLIETAVIEILTWKQGSFTLEVLPTPADDFSFYPEKLVGEINVDTQNVLMDALRIFDEKMRDGELPDEEAEDATPAKGASAAMGIQCHQCHLPARVKEVEMALEEARLVSAQRRNNTLHLDKPVDEPAAVWSPDRDVDPLTVRYIGWACYILGVALLGYGLYGLASYYGNDWQTILSEGRWEPISKADVFFRLGFLPWLFTLFSTIFLTVVRRFLLLRNAALKQMQIAAWAGIAVFAVYQAAQFILWIKIASSPSFSYYAVGIASFLLNTVLCNLPFLALLWYLQNKIIPREFFLEEGSNRLGSRL